MKIEDLTLKEIKQTCEKYNIKGTLCSSKCPIYDACCDFIYGVPSEWTTEDMERVIEGVNK